MRLATHTHSCTAPQRTAALTTGPNLPRARRQRAVAATLLAAALPLLSCNPTPHTLPALCPSHEIKMATVS